MGRKALLEHIGGKFEFINSVNTFLEKYLTLDFEGKMISFLKYILLFMLLQLSHFFLPSIPLHPVSPSHQHSPPQFMSMGHTYKFFGFSISHTILNLPLSIQYLPFMLLIPYTFPQFSLPADNPPCDLLIYDSVPVLLVCKVFQIQLLIVVY